MWILERISDGKVIRLLNSKEYTVGRRECVIRIPEDATVSRKHLVLKVDPTSSNSGDEAPQLSVKDLGSTYGTFVNPKANNPGKIVANTWNNLENGSTLHFGLQNEWRIRWEDFIILCSACAPLGRRKLGSALSKLGAKQVSDWENGITHLVMEKVVFTQKVMRGLIAAVPIVAVKYFETLVEDLEGSPESAIPNLENFIPPIDASLSIIDREKFLPKIERKTVFSGLTFIFPSQEQFEAMSTAVELAGGIALNSLTTKDGGILLEHSSRTPPQEYTSFLKTLSSQGKRAVPIKEIGWAILNCSTSRYCNPSLNLEQTLFGNLSSTLPASTSAGHPSVLAPETQTLNLPDTVSLMEETQQREPPAKKIKVEATQDVDQVVVEDPPREPPAKKRCLDSDFKPPNLIRTQEMPSTSCIDAPTQRVEARITTRRSTAKADKVAPVKIEPKSPAVKPPAPRRVREVEPPLMDDGIEPKEKKPLRLNDTTWRSTTDRTFSDLSNRMMVKLKLMRTSCSQSSFSSREEKLNSFNESSRVNTPRISKMRIASYKDGKWLKSGSVISQK